MTTVEQFLDYDKALTCIHCGLCLASCPTYLETGNENDSPRGRIYLMRAIQNGRLELVPETVRHIDLCLGCRACEAVCPSGVQYGGLLETTRQHIEQCYQRPAAQSFLRRIAIEQLIPFPNRMKLALIPALLIRALRLESWLPKFVRDSLALIPTKMADVDLPEISPARSWVDSHSSPVAVGNRSYRSGFPWERFSIATGTPANLHPSPVAVENRSHGGWEAERPDSRRVGFVRGCVMSVMFGDTNASSVALLNRCGYDVITPSAQGCCGALDAHSGNLKRAREFARRNIEAFDAYHLDTIVINAAGCGSTLKEYGHLLADDPAWAERGRQFSAKVKDLTEVLNDVHVQRATFNVQRSTGEKVTYHDACHLAHAQRITKAPRELVKAVAGKRFVELPESDVCCGSAGSYNLTEPAMAERLQRRKIENILSTGADVVVTTNPGCLLQIQAGLRKAGAPHIQVMHIADYLDRQAP